jgi:hypothetical protein
VSATARGQHDTPMKLLPHQDAFIDTALNPASKRFVLLRGDVGLGKTTAMAGLAGRLFRERPGGRVLVLCPVALRVHWLALLRNEGVSATLVDRYIFREMLEASSAGEVWPRGGVTVLSDDFAKQPDIRDSLARAKWDLVIADEAHRFAGVRATLLRHVSAAAERIVLATLPRIASPGALPVEDVTVVDWRRDQLVDLDGTPLKVAHGPALHEVSFSLGQAERYLSETIGVICQLLEGGTSQQSFTAKILLRVNRTRFSWTSHPLMVG